MISSRSKLLVEHVKQYKEIKPRVRELKNQLSHSLFVLRGKKKKEKKGGVRMRTQRGRGLTRDESLQTHRPVHT